MILHEFNSEGDPISLFSCYSGFFGFNLILPQLLERLMISCSALFFFSFFLCVWLSVTSFVVAVRCFGALFVLANLALPW